MVRPLGSRGCFDGSRTAAFASGGNVLNPCPRLVIIRPPMYTQQTHASHRETTTQTLLKMS